jgi:hypothetical protein
MQLSRHLNQKAATGVHTNFCDAIEEMRATSCLHVQKSSARSDQRRRPVFRPHYRFDDATTA